MPLADKIIELRKKQGWSQIDLADRLGVSRQSVSKWEMAQAVPELDKIIKMSELFAVTTDYLLKDAAAPEPAAGSAPPPPPPQEPPRTEAEPGPGPETETPPAAQKTRRRIWPWVLAACLAVFVVVTAVVLSLSATAAYTAVSDGQTGGVSTAVGQRYPVQDTAAGSETAQEAASDPEAVEDGMTEYVYEGESVTAGGFDEATLQTIAAEYAPYGLTCDEEHHWYLDGQRIRVFTDILSTNGESLTGGDFHGTLRTFSGDGWIDVRTVRDYDRCDDEGHGALLYLESRDIRLDSEHWVEHRAEDHPSEPRRE